MGGPMSYLLCATPRTGSTLLCSLLASTGVAGRPESYFRAPDRRMWAARFGVPVREDGTVDPSAFVAGAVRAGTTPNGVFAARLMWGSMPALVDGLDPRRGDRTDLEVLTAALGPLRVVHGHRHDVVGQAVSWARAEQSGYWQQGDRRSAEPRFDREQIDALVGTIHAHDAAWRAWFTDQGVEPVGVAYEDLVASPHDAVATVLAAIGAELPAGRTPRSPHRRQADAITADWVRRYHAAPR